MSSSRRTNTTTTTTLYPENLRLSALLFRTAGLGLSIGVLVLAIQISSEGGTPVFSYVAAIWCLILNPLDIICLLTWTRIPPGGLIFLDTLAVGFCVGGILNNIVVKNNGDGNNNPRLRNDGKVNTDDWLLGGLLAVHFIMIVSGAIDCCWMARYGRKRSSRHGSSRSRSSRSETVTRVRVTRTAV